MARYGAMALLALACAALGGRALADPAAGVLCDGAKILDQAALHDFRPILGKPRNGLGLISAGPRLYSTALILPEANDCYVRPSSLTTRMEYYCFWRSKTPEFAAADYIHAIAACLDAPASKSEFSDDLLVVSPARVSFSIGSDPKFGRDQVRLLVQSPAVGSR